MGLTDLEMKPIAGDTSGSIYLDPIWLPSFLVDSLTKAKTSVVFLWF